MKRYWMAALVAGLWAGPVQGQRESFASTIPAVPMPVMLNGEVLDPSGRFGRWELDRREGPSRRFSWNHLKTWWCFRYSPSELPKCVPTPYVAPLQGMFPCHTGWAPECGYASAPMDGQLAPYPLQPPSPYPRQPPSPMQPPTPPMVPPLTGPLRHVPGMMPTRGPQGAAIAPLWQGQVPPAPDASGIRGYRYTTPTPAVAAHPAGHPIMGAGYFPPK